TVPHLAFCAFQMMFAVITPALIAGAFAERMKFSAYVAFVLLWSTVVYDPVAHWVWAEKGWLAQRGALDFAGGTVVHLAAGVSALVCAVVLGKRTSWRRWRWWTPTLRPARGRSRGSRWSGRRGASRRRWGWPRGWWRDWWAS